jgi:hypothetical protein
MTYTYHVYGTDRKYAGYMLLNEKADRLFPSLSFVRTTVRVLCYSKIGHGEASAFGGIMISAYSCSAGLPKRRVRTYKVWMTVTSLRRCLSHVLK